MNDETLFARNDEINALNTSLDDMADAQKYLVFTVDHLRLGVVAEYVVEINTSYSITYLPMLPPHIRGIINLRGQMLPIYDLRIRLGKEPLERSLLIELNVEGTHLGILVDAVDQMLDIPKSTLLPMPANSTQLLVSGMCSLPDGTGTMMVLDCAQLMPND